MPALKEIAKKFRKTVEIEGEQLTVRGLSGDELTALMLEFPAFEKLLSDYASLDSKAMLAQAPAGIAKFIATGIAEVGTPASKDDIDDIRQWPVAAQLELLAPIAELSLPKAIVRPFVDLIRGDTDEPSGKVPATP